MSLTQSDNDIDNDEKIINWEEEATAIINDVKSHVAEIGIARKLPCNESNIYINIRTIEGETYCVHVSSMGFRIVSNEYDSINEDLSNKDSEDEEEIFETPYALLDKISPRYVESFGNQLCKQLLNLQQMQTKFNEEDEEELEEDEITLDNNEEEKNNVENEMKENTT